MATVAFLPPRTGAPLPFVEFVTMMAMIQAVGALGVDAMLPALPQIGSELGIAHENDRQFVIAIYLASFGVGQLIHGPLSDRFGRRPVMIGGLAMYVVANAAAAVATGFTVLLVTRALAGMAIASSRVVTVALVRDRFAGRGMARVMSIVSMVFIVVPVMAPTIGWGVLQVGGWRTIFWLIAVSAAIVLAWFAWRMPETLARADRLPLSWRRLAGSYRQTIADRWSAGYALGSMMLQGALIGYLTSIEQIMDVVYRRPDQLALVFALVAGTMGVASLLNSRIVMRVGSRRIAHGALVVLMAVAGIALALSWAGREPLAAFVVLEGLALACFGLAAANFSAMAMERMGAIAGTASSLQGFTIMVGGSLLGAWIGQSFAGTTVPLHLGFLLAAAGALAMAALAERGRLFRPA